MGDPWPSTHRHTDPVQFSLSNQLKQHLMNLGNDGTVEASVTTFISSPLLKSWIKQIG